MEHTEKYLVKEEETGLRLDRFLAERLPRVSRSCFQKLIQEGRVTVNLRVENRSSYRVRQGEKVILYLPAERSLEIRPQEIPLDILYEDSDLIVVNKLRGMVVHPAPGHPEGTLVNALLYYCRDLSWIGGMMRRGIVHRLDKDTSGVIVAAKNDFSHLHLARQIKNRTVKKVYLALVHGTLKETRGTIDLPIGRHHSNRKRMAVCLEGRPALTHYRVIAYLKKSSLVRIHLTTGRTHQIRVHLAYLGHPVVGDPVYGKAAGFAIKGQALHSRLIGFVHPRTGEYMECIAPVPADFRRLIQLLKVGGEVS